MSSKKNFEIFEKNAKMSFPGLSKKGVGFLSDLL